MQNSTSTSESGLESQKNGYRLRISSTSTLSYRNGALVLSNKNWTHGSTKKMIIRKSNIDECSSGTLLAAFNQLDREEASAESFELQSAISRELVSRGWQFEEDENDWFIEMRKERASE